MNIYIYILAGIISLLSLVGICIFVLTKKIQTFEYNLMGLLSRRSDTFPGLFEICCNNLNRHEEIFSEILSLRKKEFGLMSYQKEIDGYLQLQTHIHHEINFIFQVCNKNPLLLKNKKFLYIRDVIIDKSSLISNEMKKYRKIIDIYNSIIFYKNCSIIGLILPFNKKPNI